MKKLVSFVIVTGILMSLTGCGKGKADAVSAWLIIGQSVEIFAGKFFCFFLVTVCKCLADFG